MSDFTIIIMFNVHIVYLKYDYFFYFGNNLLKNFISF